jgi:hypothetical protein
LSLDLAAAGYTLQVASSSQNSGPAIFTAGINVVPDTVTKLIVAAQPPSVVSRNEGFGLTVVAEDRFGNVATNFNGQATVSLGTNAGGPGTVLSGTTVLSFSPASGTPGSVTFSGLSLNNAGVGYTLAVKTSPTVSTTTNPFEVSTLAPPPPPPPPPTITGESVVITRKFNKKHKPIGKATPSGYTITFSTTMDQTALANPANYQVALKVIKKVKVGRKKVTETVLPPIGFSVANVTTNSVTIKLAGQQKFPKGGQITVIAAAPGGVDNTSHVFLDQNGILAISPKGTGITLVS